MPKSEYARSEFYEEEEGLDYSDVSRVASPFPTVSLHPLPSLELLFFLRLFLGLHLPFHLPTNALGGALPFSHFIPSLHWQGKEVGARHWETATNGFMHFGTSPTVTGSDVPESELRPGAVLRHFPLLRSPLLFSLLFGFPLV